MEKNYKALTSLCPSCFFDKGPAKVCPACGYIAEDSENWNRLKPGTVIHGRYAVGKPLGQGGFGITYLGYDLLLETKLAIKEYFPTGVAARNSTSRTVLHSCEESREDFRKGLEKFLEEAKVLARFEGHPNIVSVRDFFEENGTAYMVMAYLEGRTLLKYLEERSGRISFEEALNILIPVMDALNEVHASGLIHRDISPDNIFLTMSGQVKLLDFGASKSALALLQNRSHSIVLKRGYSPSEQYHTRGSLGPWTDVYGMGATLYRAIAGVTPPDSLDRMAEDILPSPRQLGIDLPAYADEAILRSLALSPNKRPQSMSEFKELLTGIPDQSFSTGTFANASHSPSNVINSEQRKDPPPRRMSTLKILFFLLPVLAGLFFFLSRDSTEKVFEKSQEQNLPSGSLENEKTAVSDALKPEAPPAPAEASKPEEKPAVTEAPKPEEKSDVTEVPKAEEKPLAVVVVPPVPAGKEPLKIGYLAALTGDWAAYGQTEEKAAILAVEEINAKGGVLGRPLELLVYDFRTRAEDAVNAVRRMIEEDKVLAIVGANGSGINIATAPIVNRLGVSQVGTVSTNDLVTVDEQGKVRPYTFRICFTDPYQGKLIAFFAAKELKRMNAAILYDVGNDYSQGLREFFMKSYGEYGGKVVADHGFRGGQDVDFRAQLTDIRNKGAEVLMLPNMGKEMALIMKQARELGLNDIIFVGGDGYGEFMWEIAGSAMEGSYWINHVAPEDPEMAPFFKAYQERWKDECKEFVNGVLGYDSVYWVADAIGRAGAADPKLIRDALESTKNLKLHHATITMDPATHNPVDKDGVVLIAKDGKGQFFTKIKPTASDVVTADVGQQGKNNSEKTEVSLYQMTLQKAEKGDPVAGFDLGEIFFTGNGVPRDFSKAAEWYRKSAEQGFARAQFNLGWMYENGRGVPLDERKAAEWYRKASEQGDKRAENSLERLLASSEKADRQPETVKKEREAVSVASSKNEQGASEEKEKQEKEKQEKEKQEKEKQEKEKQEEGPQFNPAEVLEAQKLLNQLDFEAGTTDGIYGNKTLAAIQAYQKKRKMTADGLISDKLLQSLRKSVQEARKKAEKDSQKQLPVQSAAQPPTSTSEIQKPVSVVETKQTSEKPEIKQEASDGTKVSKTEAKYQYVLGKKYQQTDVVKAMECFLIAAEHGIADAQYALGDMSFYCFITINDKKVAPDHEVGTQWYEKAALQNHIPAQFKTGWAYENGLGVTINKKMAAEWYRKAAAKNHAQAQFRLGYLYSVGEGVPKDEAESLKWIRNSARSGYKTAKNYLKNYKK
ncbi:MAG: hypothetical protein EOM62_08460 [Bacteroidia bacterium]|nr:hypothetical protein [Bacteroidia bacterium]